MVTGSSVSNVAQSIGNAEFLFPAGVISPFSLFPPLTINFDILVIKKY